MPTLSVIKADTDGFGDPRQAPDEAGAADRTAASAEGAVTASA